MDLPLPSNTIGSQTIYLNRRIQTIAVYAYIVGDRMKLDHNILDPVKGVVSITIPELDEGVYPYSVFSLAGNTRSEIYNSTLTIENVPAGGGAETFESVSKNIKSYPSVITYDGDDIDFITYTVSGGTIIKTFNYTDSILTSIVLSGNTPNGIDLTKTLTYTGDALTGIQYS